MGQLQADQLGNDSYWAARLALLAMRATCKGVTAGALEEYRLPPRKEPLDTVRAAYVVGGLGKPLDCRPKVRSGLLEVHCRSLEDPKELALDAWIKRGVEESGGLFSFLRDHIGDDFLGLPVLCVGRLGEYLTVPVSSVLVFHRDYTQNPHTGFTLVPTDEQGRLPEWIDGQLRSSAPAALLFARPSGGLNLGLSVPKRLLALFKWRYSNL